MTASSTAGQDAGPLPRPATATDQYLAAVLHELRGIRRLLEQEDDMDTVELREPERPDPTPVPLGGGWYQVGGERVRGREAAQKRARELRGG